MKTTRRPPVPVRCADLIDAPVGAVRRALGQSQVWIRAATAVGGRLGVARDATGMVEAGLVRFTPGAGRTSVLLRVHECDGLPVLESAVPHLGVRIAIRIVLASTAAGTLVTIEFSVRSRLRGVNSALRRRLIRYGEMIIGMTTLVAREPIRVVAAAVIRDGRVLVARRAPGRSRAGLWELPGGKVEPGETDRQALTRELIEELALHTSVLGRIGPVVDVGDGLALYCYQAEVVGDDPIVLVDHDDYRWVGADELGVLELLESDRHLVESLRITLQIHR
ncbi:8-oxo-dGTP diphosphatase [Nakamurella sp. UYEF19]|uniref:(deoxy)nucleoside triphosphate pyrophosphohydrolase n=1 Tax=Nakamurella sp. UYEF19 TaxID=1756392 RepID=UPI00339A8E9E